MKALLIAASIVGIAGAGAILYLQRISRSERPKQLASGSDMSTMARPAHHAMG